jgi:hypothetical protein
MFTLSIEHAVTDFPTWKAAFDRFSQARIRRKLDDPRYLVIELDFDTSEQAERFRRFLTDTVWASPDSSPALAGTPMTRILEPAAS